MLADFRRSRKAPTRVRSAQRRVSQLLDRLEGAVLLNDGEEDLGGRILTLASGLDMSVTVEGVETRDQIYRPLQDAAQAVNL